MPDQPNLIPNPTETPTPTQPQPETLSGVFSRIWERAVSKRKERAKPYMFIVVGAYLSYILLTIYLIWEYTTISLTRCKPWLPELGNPAEVSTTMKYLVCQDINIFTILLAVIPWMGASLAIFFSLRYFFSENHQNAQQFFSITGKSFISILWLSLLLGVIWFLSSGISNSGLLSYVVHFGGLLGVCVLYISSICVLLKEQTKGFHAVLRSIDLLTKEWKLVAMSCLRFILKSLPSIGLFAAYFAFAGFLVLVPFIGIFLAPMFLVLFVPATFPLLTIVIVNLFAFSTELYNTIVERQGISKPSITDPKSIIILTIILLFSTAGFVKTILLPLLY